MILHRMHAEVHKKFPDSEHLVLSGFFFLRFLSPAIVSPYAYGIVDGTHTFKHERTVLNLDADELPPACARGLVLVSKVIQNLANGIEFGEAQKHMVPFNTFIKHHKIVMDEFLAAISKKPKVRENNTK